ncbi:MAG: hypothetical protein K2H19_04355 [Ruminococcus sp.]|nr:hypothetical protein [Ruminococcus sp.]
MKKLISIITSGMLAVMPAVQIPFSVYAVEAETFVISEETNGTVSVDNYAEGTITTQQAETVTTTPLSAEEIRAFFEYDDTEDMPTVNIGEKLDLNKINLRVSAQGIDSKGNQYKAGADELNYTFSIGSGKHSDCYNYDTSEVDNATEAGIRYIYIESHPYTTDKFILENSSSEELPNGEYKFTIRNQYHNGGGDGDFYIPVKVIDPSAPPVTTQAPPTNGEIRANLDVYGYVPPVCINEEIDLNKVNLSIGAWGFDSNDDWYEENANKLNYNFSIGSGKHSDCYTYDISDVDTSKVGIYYIHVTAVPNVSDKFVLENSVSEKLPNGTYKFVMQDKDFYIPVEVIDPSIPIATEPEYTGMTTNTTTKANICLTTNVTTATTTEDTHDCTTAPPSAGEIRAEFEYNVNNKITVNVGDELDLNKVNISVIALTDDSIYVRDLNYEFSIGSGKHSKCYIYDASGVDTSTAGTYIIYVNPISDVTDKFIIENSESSKIPNGEYEFVMKGGYHNDFGIPVEVIDPDAPITTTEATEPQYTGMTTTTATEKNICDITTHPTNITTEEIVTNSCTTTTIPTTTTPPVMKKLKGYMALTKSRYYTALGEEFDVSRIEPVFALHIINEDGSELFCSADNPPFEKIKDLYTIDTSEIDTSKLGCYQLKFESVGGITEKFDIKNAYYLPDGEYEIEMESQINYIDILVTNDSEHLNPPVNTTQSGNSDTIITATTTATIPKEPTVIKEIKGYITPKQYFTYTSYLGEKIDPRKIELELVLHIINQDGTEVFRVTECDINSLAEKYANCYTLDTSNINTSELGNYSLKVECIGGAVNTFDIKDVLGLKDGEYEIEMEADVSYIEVYVNNKPETTTTIIGSQSGNNTETTSDIIGTTLPVINLNPETTETTTTVSDTNETNENTNAVPDYRTKLEYDNSPMKIGETRAIHVYIPATATASKTYISEVPENIDVSYTDGSDTFYITALEAGDISFYVRESSCAFGDYVNLTITEELFSETTTTTEENTPETTTTTTQPTEELPQTGYSDIYKWIVYFALLMTATGTAVTIYSKKRVK